MKLRKGPLAVYADGVGIVGMIFSISQFTRLMTLRQICRQSPHRVYSLPSTTVVRGRLPEQGPDQL